MKRFGRRLERLLGRTGVVALGLLAAAAAFWLSGVLPAESDAARLRSELARAAAPAQTVPGGVQSTEASLARFYRAFATPDEAYAALHGVFRAAKAEHLTLDKGEYRLSRERDSGLLRYQIVFPLVGSYPRIRRFIVRALNEAPGMALEDLSLRRTDPKSDQVKARVQFALYLGGGR